MAYDPKAVKIKKATKAIALLSFNKDIERLFIREMVKVEERNARSRTSRNRGGKDAE